MRYVIASSRVWYDYLSKKLANETGSDFFLIKSKEELTYEQLEKIQPQYVFFPHWSFIIPKEIYDNFECVIFHMTDLPFGRGGSPLQNLIARGIYETRITALRCTADIDSGPIYLKRPLSLYGGAEEIYLRASEIIGTMINDIVLQTPKPVDQEGDIVYFQRRKPKDGDISKLTELNQVFDYIRMLDADGYPKAFLETDKLHLEFKRPSFKQGKIVADVIITEKKFYE